MAWVLIKRVDESQKCMLLTGQEYAVGRKDTNIVLPDDLSISRMHAIIRVENFEKSISTPQRLPMVTIRDTSKYGTVVNGKKLEKEGASSLLNSDDTIQFGIFENVWKIKYTPFVCTTSGLSKADKRSVAQNIIRIGGHLVNEWSDDCTHLIMTNVFMTMKVVNALVSCAPILTAKVLEDVVTNKSWPVDFKQYEPKPEKSKFYSDDANFQPDARRQNILRGKTFFVFTSKQESKIKFSITKSGGKVILTDSKSMTENIARDEKNCLLEPPKEIAENSSFRKLTSLLRKCGIRFVSEGEIGLAVLLCSTNKYCNSKTNEGVIMQGTLPESQISTIESTQMTYDSVAEISNESVECPTMELDEPCPPETEKIGTRREESVFSTKETVTAAEKPVTIKIESMEMNENSECTEIASVQVFAKPNLPIKKELAKTSATARARRLPSDQFISTRHLSPFKMDHEKTSCMRITVAPCMRKAIPDATPIYTNEETSRKTFKKVPPKRSFSVVKFQEINNYN